MPTCVLKPKESVHIGPAVMQIGFWARSIIIGISSLYRLERSYHRDS